MGRNKEEVQDRWINNMERTNKYSTDDRSPKILTLKEQLDQQARLDKMSPGERLSAMSWIEWEIALKNHIRESREVSLTDASYTIVMSQCRLELEKMHRRGDGLIIVAQFVSDMANKHAAW